MSPNDGARMPIVFVHGLWLHAESWNNCVAFFREQGYNATAVSWPGDAATTAATRKTPAGLAGYSMTEITDHIAGQLKAFPRKTIPVRNSFDGELAQNVHGF